MKRSLTAVFILFAVFYMFGCSSSQPTAATEGGNVPEWYLNTPQDPNYLFAPSTASSKDLQLAVDKAVTDARAEIGRQVETQVQGLQKKFDEEVGVGDNSTLLSQFTQATKTVVNQSLNGSNVQKKEVLKDGQNWRAYVLVAYPIGAANTAMMDQIKKNQEMYTRFRSSQTFEELDKEVKKYEEWKDKQGQQ